MRIKEVSIGRGDELPAQTVLLEDEGTRDGILCDLCTGVANPEDCLIVHAATKDGFFDHIIAHEVCITAIGEELFSPCRCESEVNYAREQYGD